MNQNYSLVAQLGLLLVCMTSCQQPKEKSEPNKMNVVGTIKGLRKGTLYLQKINDTVLVNIDSTKIIGLN